MKKLHDVVILCLTGFSLLGQAQTVQVQIAGNNYPVAFADAGLSATNQQRIASDLTIVFSFTLSLEELKGLEIETGVFQADNSTMLSTEESESVFIIDRNNEQNIRVDKALSDKYQQAFTVMDAHSNAVQKANAFVAFLNSTNLLSRPANEIVSKVRHVPLEDADALSDNAIREFFDEPQQVKFPGFSALHFSIQQLPQFNGAEVPVIYPFFVIHKSDPSKNIAAPIDFYKGKWGFGRSPW